MSSKPETTFIASVHRHMPPIGRGSYHLKNYNVYNGGIADCWYSGQHDLWVEYKFIVVPKRDTTMILPECSALQLEWLSDRHHEGRNVAVIVGCKDGSVVYVDKDWELPMSAADFRNRMLNRRDTAAWLCRAMKEGIA